MRYLFLGMMMLLFVGSADIAISQTQPTESKEPEKRYLYKWVDSKGVMHLTDNLGEVPEKYRKKIQIEEQAASSEESKTEPRRESRSLQESDQSLHEEERKADWQQRIQSARQRLADAERRYRELDEKRTALLGSWGGVASGHLEGRMKAQEIEQQMKGVQDEIQSARHELEVTIPDDARKQGIPPGWLRE
ncbi:MAG: DUF4124 domain-containing protein [Nitrospirota bacterium]